MGIFGQSQQGQPRYNGELHNLSVTEAVFGTCAPIPFGTVRVHQKLLFYGGFYAVTAPNSGGKGIFGGKATEWDYYADVLMLLAQSAYSQACGGILNVWDQQGKLQNESYTYSYTIPGSSPNVIPSTSPAVGADLGVYHAQSYSVVANNYGGGGSHTLTGTQNVKFVKVASSPGAGQYSFNPATGQYTFSVLDVGKSVAISYSTVFSLYYFEQTQAAVIPGSPYQVSTDNEAYFYSDLDVTRVDTGAALTPGTDYTEGSGVYTFNSTLAGVTVYINYTYTSSSADISNSSTLNLTFFNGAPGQSPWSYMTSKYPGAAFGYSGLCYLGANPLWLGQAASMPSYNYELMGLATFGGGIPDAHPCDALLLLLTDPFIGVGFPSANIDAWVNCYAYWASNNYFISISLDTQQSAADALRQVIETGNVAPVWSGGLLKLIPYGDATTVGNGYTYTPPTTPAFTLTWDDLLPPSEKKTGEASSDDLLQVTVKAPQDCMNYVQAQWTNRANSYNNELTPEQNDAFIRQYGFRPESPQTWDFITTQTAATWALNLRLKRNCYIRNTYKTWLPFWFAAIEPMDMIVLPTGEPVRVTQVEDAHDGRLAIEYEQWTYGSADVTLYAKQPPSGFQPNYSQGIPGNSVPVFIQNTTLQSNGVLNKLQIAASGQNSNWGGCNVLISLDGISYTNIGKVMSSGVIGQLSGPLGSSSDPDTADTLSVDISIGAGANAGAQLVSVTQAQADNLVTLAAIVDQGGLTNELIAYETASLTAQNRYNLTYLRRGAYGTNIVAHTTGAWFAYLGTGYPFLDYQYSPQYVGQELYVKLQSFNLAGGQLQDLAQCTVWNLFISAQNSSISEAYVPSVFTPSTGFLGTVTNPAYAYDRNFSSAAVFDSGPTPGGPNPTGGTYSGFGSGLTATATTLYLTYENLRAATLSQSDQVIILTSCLDGTSFVTWFNSPEGGEAKAGAATIPLASVPAGTNLADISVLVTVVCYTPGDVAHIEVVEIWLEGQPQGVQGLIAGSGIAISGGAFQTISATGAGGNSVTAEHVSGGPTSWTLAHTPLAGTLQLFSGSAAIWPGALPLDYTIAGAAITTNYAITAGTLYANYSY